MPATIAPAREPRRGKPRPPAVCTLTLTIAGQDYRIKGIDAPAFGSTSRAYSLRKVGADARYHAVATPHGPACDCPDYIFRREGIDPAGCKHLRALKALGLLR